MVYELDPHWLVDCLESLPDYDQTQKGWNEYRQKNPEESRDDSPYDWDETYLPGYSQPLAQVPFPVKLSEVPAFAPNGAETKPYSLEEIAAMLKVLSEPSATAVATAAFTGLRLGELR